MHLTPIPVFLVSVSFALSLSLQSGIAGEAFFSKEGKTVTMGLNNALLLLGIN